MVAPLRETYFIGRKIFLYATCQLQFAKASSAAKLPQEEKSNSGDVNRSRLNIPGFM